MRKLAMLVVVTVILTSVPSRALGGWPLRRHHYYVPAPITTQGAQAQGLLANLLATWGPSLLNQFLQLPNFPRLPGMPGQPGQPGQPAANTPVDADTAKKLKDVDDKLAELLKKNETLFNPKPKLAAPPGG